MNLKDRLLRQQSKLAVVGLGYVGIPLAISFARKVPVIGYDISESKVEQYRSGIDPTGELEPESLLRTEMEFTADESRLGEADFVIVAVPTPVYADKRPNLDPVLAASRTVGRNLSKGTVVVYESTVYPGVTEEICAPILEEESGLVCGKDFFVGYSPERINPADKAHRLENIVKVVSGMDENTLKAVAEVYELVVEAGVFRAASIRVAEAVKLVENAQRDVNIAFMNELSMYFDLIGVDTQDVLSGMATKWNALPFRPGLVGGHCIGVDPYYFIYQAEKVGFEPNIIYTSRRLNDSMGRYVAEKTVRALIRCDKMVRNAKVYVLGATFKENCPDLRNSKVRELVECLREFGVEPKLSDDIADVGEMQRYYGCDPVAMDRIDDADCIVFAVAHDAYRSLKNEQIDRMFAKATGKPCAVIDVKRMFDRAAFEQRGYCYWGL